MNSFIVLIGLALLGSVAGLFGGVLFLLKPKWSNFLVDNSVPFAAGVLTTIALIDLLPESQKLVGESAFLIVLITVMIAFIFEQFFAQLHHHDHNDHHNARSRSLSVPLVLAGDTIHNFVDGIAIGASFLVDPRFGFVVAMSTFLHEVPHEIGDFGIMVAAGYSKKKAFVVNLLSSLITIPGVFMVYFLVPGQSFVGSLLAVSAGLFLYLGMSDFMPQIEGNARQVARKAFILLLGVISMLVFLKAFTHTA